jgi:hypothetical protein
VYIKAAKRAQLAAVLQPDKPLPPCKNCPPLDDAKTAPAYTLDNLRGQIEINIRGSTANWLEAALEESEEDE